MRNPSVLTILLALAACGGAVPDSARREIIRLEEGLARAVTQRDTAAMRPLLAPEFVVAGRNVDEDVRRPPLVRDEWLEQVAGARVQSDSLWLGDFEVAGTADSAAATYRMYWRFRFNDTLMPPEDITVRDIWRRREGRWVAVERRILEMRNTPTLQVAPQ